MQQQTKIKLRLTATIVFIIISIFCVLYGTFTVVVGQQMLEAEYAQMKANAQSNVMDIVLAQTELQAKSLKDAFLAYDRIYKPQWFKMQNGGYVFHNINLNKDYVFYPYSMELRKTYNNKYDIYRIPSGEVVAKNVSPEWNRRVLNNFLDIAVRNVRMFGPEGDPIITDSYTKEILVDDSYNCADTPEVLGMDGRRYMSLDYLHPNNANPDACKWVIDNILTWNNDQVWMYFFTAPDITVEDLQNNDAFNLEKHPLKLSTDIGRELGYTIVIEIKNDFGMVLPLRVMFGAQEYEFIQYFKDMY